MVAISDAGTFAYELIDPTAWGSAVTQTYTPAAVTSGLIAFVYLDTSAKVRIGYKTSSDGAWQYYAGPEEIGGVAMDIAGEFRFHSQLGIAPDDTLYMNLERTNYDVYTSLKNVGTQDWDELMLVGYNAAWCVNASSGDPWLAYAQTSGANINLLFETAGAAAETAESYASADYLIDCISMCSTTDGRIWAAFNIRGSGYDPAKIGQRLVIRGAAGGYTFVNLPLPDTYNLLNARVCRATSDAVMVLGRCRINGTSNYDIVLWSINPDTLNVTTYTVVAATTLPYELEITTTDSGVPCVVRGQAAGSQMLWYLNNGVSWDAYTTAYAGGFMPYIRTAWNAYV